MRSHLSGLLTRSRSEIQLTSESCERVPRLTFCRVSSNRGEPELGWQLSMGSLRLRDCPGLRRTRRSRSVTRRTRGAARGPQPEAPRPRVAGRLRLPVTRRSDSFKLAAGAFESSPPRFGSRWPGSAGLCPVVPFEAPARGPLSGAQAAATSRTQRAPRRRRRRRGFPGNSPTSPTSRSARAGHRLGPRNPPFLFP
jgi:hypothetical protein